METGCSMVIVLVAVLGLASGEAVNRFISHYEPLHYDSSDFMYHHWRLRRTLIGENHVPLKFNAFGRSFHLTLHPETKMFHKDFTLMIDGEVVRNHQYKSMMYTGVDHVDPSITALGNVHHGVFEGTVFTPDELYHIEPAHKYFNDSSFHSIIYRASDLDLSSVAGATCGTSDNKIRRQILQTQTSAYNRNSHKGNKEHTRLRKRQTPDPRVRCWLSIDVDERYTESVGGESVAMANIFNIVQQASSIYSENNFDGVGTGDMIHFGIRRIDISSMPPLSTDRFASDFIGVQTFLDLHSSANYSDFCLAYRFTHRDFDDGVLGLAYVAPQPGANAIGGICEKAGVRNGVVQTLNTGIVSNLNYGNTIPVPISILTFAHEAGHNFGSNHDTDPPDPTDGAFIMYAFANDGSQPNNRKFSSRSINEMFQVIRERREIVGCLLEADDFCGNGLLDDMEMCDCGAMSNRLADGTCINDRCCNGTSCMLVSDVQCSADQGPCCNASTCMFINGTVCSSETECALAQSCNGSSAKCPTPTPIEPTGNDTFILCNNGENVCNNGVCDGTACTALNLTVCGCVSDAEACDLCCKFDNGSCISTFAIANDDTFRSKLPNKTGQNLQVGFPCQNFTGYCDFFLECMVVDNDGALNNLARFFFSTSFQRIIQWITNMWWVVLIAGVGMLVILFVLVIIVHVVLPRPKHRRKKGHSGQREQRELHAYPQHGQYYKAY